MTATGSAAGLGDARARRSRSRARRCASARAGRGSRASASTSGVERDPGEVQASVIPQRASSSTNAAIRSCRRAGCARGCAGTGPPKRVRGRDDRLTRARPRPAARLRRHRAPLGPRDRRRCRRTLRAARAGRSPGADAADARRRRARSSAAAAPERFALAGYSMGGRLALHAALAMPERVDAARARLGERRDRGRGGARGAPRRRRGAGRARSSASAIEWFVERWRADAAVRRRPATWVAEEVAARRAPLHAGELAACLRGARPGRDARRCGSGSASSSMPVDGARRRARRALRGARAGGSPRRSAGRDARDRRWRRPPARARGAARRSPRGRLG